MSVLDFVKFLEAASAEAASDDASSVAHLGAGIFVNPTRPSLRQTRLGRLGGRPLQGGSHFGVAASEVAAAALALFSRSGALRGVPTWLLFVMISAS